MRHVLAEAATFPFRHCIRVAVLLNGAVITTGLGRGEEELRPACASRCLSKWALGVLVSDVS